MRAAQEICVDFLQRVVIARVFSEAERTAGNGPLDDQKRRRIASGQEIDARSPQLLRISGKGGWSADPERAALFAAYMNVSLLDHVLSVMRGALVFAARDLLPDEASDTPALRGRLAVVAAVAFLHDADKMLAIGRSEARSGGLDAAAMEGLVQRFGLDAFLASYGVALSGKVMLELVNGVEVTSTQGLVPVPRDYWRDRAYVRLADRLDGTFLQMRPLDRRPHFGAEGALRELDAIRRSDRAGADRSAWRIISLRDPHTPFLLDAFQAALSAECTDRHGFPPMIELHHDGRLLVVLPSEGFDALTSAALGRVTAELGARMRIATNNRGKIDLLDAPGTVADLRDSVAALRARDRDGVLRASVRSLRQHQTAIDDFLRPSDFLPRLPNLDEAQSALVPLWASPAGDDDQFLATQRDAVLIGAVLSCTDPPARKDIPTAATRETELRRLLETNASAQWPAFLESLPEDTRRALLAGYAAGMAQQDEGLRDALIGPDGLVAVWLEGRADRPGLSSAIDRSALRLGEAVEAHYRALLDEKLVVAPDEAATGRCHFTNAPVPHTASISGKTGLLGVKISAFSGREGRPEHFRSAVSETLVSPIAEAEHRLRSLQLERSQRSPAGRGVAVAITSPTTAGLFGALPFANDADVDEFSLADLARRKIEAKSPVFRNAEAFLRRTRIARFEEFPDRMTGAGNAPGQIAFVRMVLDAARRTGRPVHVFRGLSRPRPEFVAFDTLPQSLGQLLGGDAYRLEQIDSLIYRLRGIEAVVEITGFGLELALRICDPSTRFASCCDALARAEHRLSQASHDPNLSGLRHFLSDLLETDTVPTSSDKALLEFGQAMARVQRSPRWEDGDNRLELGLRLALDTVERLEPLCQTAPDSLVAGVSGELEKALTRKGLHVRKEFRGGLSIESTIEAAARIFVERVWYGAFRGVMPASRHRRTAFAVYRWGFKSASRQLYASNGMPMTEEETAFTEEAEDAA